MCVCVCVCVCVVCVCLQNVRSASSVWTASSGVCVRTEAGATDTQASVAALPAGWETTAREVGLEPNTPAHQVSNLPQNDA